MHPDPALMGSPCDWTDATLRRVAETTESLGLDSSLYRAELMRREEARRPKPHPRSFSARPQTPSGFRTPPEGKRSSAPGVVQVAEPLGGA